MRKIRVKKTIEEIPLNKAVSLVRQVLDKPQNVSEEDFANQIKKDLITGKKFFRIREIALKEKFDI